MQQTAQDIVQEVADAVFDAGEFAIEETDKLCKALKIDGEQANGLIEHAWALASHACYEKLAEGLNEETAGRVYQHLRRKCLAEYREKLRHYGRAQADALGVARLLDLLPAACWRETMAAN